MAPDNSEILALLADLLRATDRQTEENSRKIDELRTEMRQTAAETNARFEAIFDRFATAVADGFIRVEKKIDAVKQEVGELRTDVQRIDQRLARVEQNQAAQADMLHRLEVLESIVLRKAS
ncbi:hypothetical protein [Hymenobacter guriensis]|uniref:Uncharacterized protein n=1 Tax=Hymenobacter guriensis TaxID=2793065 RepID=A0ABS0L621_9BACT|nr:hypothetical protein [Hymenobacter guriensis]MBG8554807.1 hypothetical protein [Hymenobacter guriensis]